MTEADSPIAFYRLAAGHAPASPSLPPGVRGIVWRPTWRSVRPPGAAGGRWVAWWLMDRLHLFGNRGYAVVLVLDPTDAVVHRSCVFPPWLRFPFMDRRDLQIGDVWTALAWRRQGLAAWAITTTVAGDVEPTRQFWYLTEAGNEASVHAIEKSGFHRVGSGHRVARLRIRALGQFVLR